MRDAPPDPPTLNVSSSFPGELMIWLSASFPVGGFAYSHGLETAVERGWVIDRPSLSTWLTAIIRHGSLRNDLILLALLIEASAENDLHELAALSAALQPCAERSAEALVQGRNFAAAFRSAWAHTSDPFAGLELITLPAALAVAVRTYRLPTAAALEAYAISFCSNLISAAIRLGAVGQFDGQQVMANALPEIRTACSTAITSSIDDLGSATYGIDLASMLHETQTTRLFRS